MVKGEVRGQSSGDLSERRLYHSTAELLQSIHLAFLFLFIALPSLLIAELLSCCEEKDSVF